MFSPIGNLPPSTYWRRRIFVIGGAVLLVLLLVLTIKVVAGGGGDDQQAASDTSSSSTPTRSPVAPSTTSPSTSPPAGAANGAAPSSLPSVTSPAAPGAGSTPVTTAPPARCAARDLTLQAAVGQSTYKVGAQPLLSLQVTNAGSRPCVQDIADKQVVLRVYNGESRVWGSHDCEIQPGTTDRTLLVNQPVRVSIPWSARTSQEGCKGARQRVGAGSYTLYAQLGSKSAKAARFTIN